MLALSHGAAWTVPDSGDRAEYLEEAGDYISDRRGRRCREQTRQLHDCLVCWLTGASQESQEAPACLDQEIPEQGRGQGAARAMGLAGKQGGLVTLAATECGQELGLWERRQV